MTWKWARVMSLVAAAFAGEALAAKPIVEVFDIQTERVRLSRGAKSALSK